jgi:hypothetical protein
MNKVPKSSPPLSTIEWSAKDKRPMETMKKNTNIKNEWKQRTSKLCKGNKSGQNQSYRQWLVMNQIPKKMKDKGWLVALEMYIDRDLP